MRKGMSYSAPVPYDEQTGMNALQVFIKLDFHIVEFHFHPM
jgi:hypothetical protein